MFPNTDLAANISSGQERASSASDEQQLYFIFLPVFTAQLTVEKVGKELAYFHREPASSFERTYGWAWLLKLQEQLLKVNTDWSDILHPLVQHIVQLWTAFLPNLLYPVRVGEHTNTAFGLSFAIDFSRQVVLNGILFGKSRLFHSTFRLHLDRGETVPKSTFQTFLGEIWIFTK